MRLLTMAAALLATTAGGCVELGVITDGTSVSVGRPSNGYLRDGHRLPNSGEGFMTRDVWRTRGNRYGTDELLDMITGVGRRLAAHKGPRLVIADLSGPNGGESRKWHRSHQSGRDVDLVYYMKDAKGAPFEADSMRVFNAQGVAVDGSGTTVDIPRTWLLVKELVMAHEATVQWVFMYEPIAQKVIEHAVAQNEPEGVIARVRLALKQPGDSAPHNDHMHVRIYCSERDRAFGCVDIGPRELYLMRLADRQAAGDYPQIVASLIGDAAHTIAAEVASGSAIAEAEGAATVAARSFDGAPSTGAPRAIAGTVSDALPSGAQVSAGAQVASANATAVMGVPRDLPALGRILRRPFDRILQRFR